MLEHYTGATIGTNRLIAEGLLKGEQVTVEGYVQGGVATIFGVVDSIMFPGTLAFSRFDYPSHLPEACRRAWARSPRRRCRASASTTASSISR